MIDLVMQCYLEYTATVLPYKYTFEYEDGTSRVLIFKPQDIIHQLGLDRLNKYYILKTKGEKGIASRALYDLRKNKITIDMIHHDKAKEIILNKLVNYRFLTALLGDTKTEHYRFDQNKVPCDIPADYMLYDRQNNLHFHFGSINIADDNVSPMTWFVENDRPEKYILNQDRIYLKKIIIEKI